MKQSKEGIQSVKILQDWRQYLVTGIWRKCRSILEFDWLTGPAGLFIILLFRHYKGRFGGWNKSRIMIGGSFHFFINGQGAIFPM
jgi:hypothetical protein